MNVTAIHLYRNGTHVRVAIEVGGRWVRVIEERIEDAFSHIVEESGMRAASTDGCNCGAENYNRRKPPVEMTHALNCSSRAASTRPEAAQASEANPAVREDGPSHSNGEFLVERWWSDDAAERHLFRKGDQRGWAYVLGWNPNVFSDDVIRQFLAANDIVWKEKS